MLYTRSDPSLFYCPQEPSLCEKMCDGKLVNQVSIFELKTLNIKLWWWMLLICTLVLRTMQSTPPPVVHKGPPRLTNIIVQVISGIVRTIVDCVHRFVTTSKVVILQVFNFVFLISIKLFLNIFFSYFKRNPTEFNCPAKGTPVPTVAPPTYKGPCEDRCNNK